MRPIKLFLSLIFLSVINWSFAQENPGGDRLIELEDVYGKDTFAAQGTQNFRFSDDGKHYYQIGEKGDLLKLNLADGELADTLLTRERLKRSGAHALSLSGHIWNRDEDLILLHSERKSIYRYSYTSIPWLYAIEQDSLYQLFDQAVQNLSFSPDGRRIAYCRDNNVFIYDIDKDKEIQISDAPANGPIHNGTSDWIYEETFGVVRAYKWSGDGKYIAYYNFDTSEVPVHQFPIYDAKSLKEENYAYKYYRPGEPISKVSIYIADLETGTTRAVATPSGEEYFPRIYWAKDKNVLFIYRIPRSQKSLEIARVDASTGNYTPLVNEEDSRYIDRATFDAFYSFAGGDRFIYMSEREGWRRLYRYDMRTGSQQVLTPFQYDTDRLIGVDEKAGILYCSVAEDPRERQVIAIPLGKGKVRPLSSEPGWHSLTFNQDFSHYLETYSNMNRPTIYTLYTKKGKEIRVLEANAGLQDTLKQFRLAVPEFLQIPNRHGVALNAWVLFPPDYTEDKKYPVLFANYGGPGSQRVTNRWGAVNFWYQHLAQRGIIVVCVDNTGTGFRGTDFKKAVYGKLGIQEIEDQMDAARWLSTRYPSVDRARIAYWGWSFGGFMASMAITYGAEVFNTAIAVAPVTNWKFYQSGYAERHMGLLNDNPDGYARSTPMAYIDRMKGNFLLIHGTGDDNVHFRNSAVFSQALIKAGKRFAQQYYPDKDHAIGGTQTRFHLYRFMTDYLFDKLKEGNQK